MLYFLLIDNQAQGPFSEKEIRTRVKAGTLRSSNLVCEEGGEQWKPVYEWFGNLEYKLPSAPKDVADSPNGLNLDKLNHKSFFWSAFLSKFPQPIAIVYESGAKSALKFATPAAAIGGFVADVLQPIAPISLYLFIVSTICVIICGMGAWLLRQNFESTMRRRCSSLCSFTTVCSILFGTSWFFFTSNCPDKGFLATRVDAIDSMQASLLGVQQSVEHIDSTVTQVSTDVGAIKSDVKNISQGVSGLGKMGGIITNPTTPVEFYNNALIFKERGDLASQRKALEAFVKTGEQKIEPFDMLIDALKGMEGPEGARKAYEELIKTNPNNVMLQTYLFSLLEATKAVAHLRSIIETNPDFTPAYFLIMGGRYNFAYPGFLLADTDECLQKVLLSLHLDHIFKILPFEGKWWLTPQYQSFLKAGKGDAIDCHMGAVDFYKKIRTPALEQVLAEIDAKRTSLLKKNGLLEIYTAYEKISQKSPLRIFLYDSTNGLYSNTYFPGYLEQIKRCLKNIDEEILERTQENNELIQEAERVIAGVIKREEEQEREAARGKRWKEARDSKK